jgi:hypothetical protein
MPYFSAFARTSPRSPVRAARTAMPIGSDRDAAAQRHQPNPGPRGEGAACRVSTRSPPRHLPPCRAVARRPQRLHNAAIPRGSPPFGSPLQTNPSLLMRGHCLSRAMRCLERYCRATSISVGGCVLMPFQQLIAISVTWRRFRSPDAVQVANGTTHCGQPRKRIVKLWCIAVSDDPSGNRLLPHGGTAKANGSGDINRA